MPVPAPSSAPGQLATEDLEFLLRACKASARRFTRADSGLPQDLYQAALVYYLSKAAEGWFDQPVRLSLLQQRRHLLMLSLKEALKPVWRRASNEVSEAHDRGEDETQEGSDSSTIADPAAIDAAELLGNRELADRALDLCRTKLNPARRLILVGLHWPQRLLREELGQAQGFTKGGASWVVRPLAEAWELVQRYRGQDEVVGDEVLWKRVLAQIIRLEGEIGLAPSVVIDTAVNTLQVNHDRAMEQLRDLLGGEDDP